jgi:hypothetical protein
MRGREYELLHYVPKELVAIDRALPPTVGVCLANLFCPFVVATWPRRSGSMDPPINILTLISVHIPTHTQQSSSVIASMPKRPKSSSSIS